MSEQHETEAAFIKQLVKLQQDAGAMAEIRRAAKTGQVAGTGAARHVVMLLGKLRVPDWDEQRFFTVAGLFAQVHTQANRFRPSEDYYESSTRRNLGWCFRKFKETEGMLAEENSTDQRFVRLLNSHPEDLPARLRHAVRLLNSSKPPVMVDWIRLLSDLRYFHRPERWVQQSWAREFWKYTGKQNDQKPAKTGAASA